MINFSPNIHRGALRDSRLLFIDTFCKQIAALEEGRAQFRIPESRNLYERHPEMAYHFKPELFIQLGGATKFTLPGTCFTLETGEICVMPKGVPHGERTCDGRRPFENIVVCYYNETVAIHVAHETAQSKPIVDDIYFFTTPLYDDLVGYLNRICELRSHDSEPSRIAVKGLLLAEMALLLEIVQQRGPGCFSESERVFKCEWLIRNNIADPEMTVESLAGELRCSPDYLTRLFRNQTGERILEYITRIRLHNALDAIQHSPLSMKEIATACGFNDPSYFARIFRKYTGRSPTQYRHDLDQLSCAIEPNPKVVYFDHEERNFGLRPEIMDRATLE